jgi:2-oxoacid:acceptor oxidoreductase delta subunit (pyruvate/2-ketoisovalerate family)
MERKPFAITLDVGSSRANKTGAWRTERPVYVSNLPPCNNACPAGENIQQWLYRAEEAGSLGGKTPLQPPEKSGYEAAWRQIMADNPLPAIMGRVCYRPCETACNRAQLDSAVGINSVERFLGDEAIRHGWQVPVDAAPTGKRVLVVGAGPSGLSAAYHLTRMGHAVTIRDANAEPGGMMRYGIPRYRLPRHILDAEINRILAMGVTLELNAPVTDLTATLTADGFDAAFVAVGAHIGKRAYIPAGDSAKIIDAVTMLRGMEDSSPPLLGRRVAVYGGGNTAMDAARTARRLGAADAVVVYRRTRDRMPAHDSEVTEALEEGVTIRWLSTVARADEGKLLIEKMRLDESGFPQPTGEFEDLDADCLVLALGQDADLSVLESVPDVTFSSGVVDVGPDLMTGHPGIFAGGDMVPAERTVTVAIGHGKKAARSIDAWLRGTIHIMPPRHDLAAYSALNTWYYADAPATVRAQLDTARRITTFDEVTGGLDESTALFEARRCLSCGNCFGCDNCYGVCPDNAVIKLGTGQYEIDYDYCKGCGICAAECPSGAIEMEPEQT